MSEKVRIKCANLPSTYSTNICFASFTQKTKSIAVDLIEDSTKMSHLVHVTESEATTKVVADLPKKN